MRFEPPHCPYADGACKGATSFQYQRRGSFRRHCDGRDVQRFVCKGCRRTFSSQTFRFDYRLRKPALSEEILIGFVSKVTQRQIARTRFCNMKTIAARLVCGSTTTCVQVPVAAWWKLRTSGFCMADPFGACETSGRNACGA
jgi:transposase-like protein